MKQNALTQRLFFLLITLSVFPLFLSGNGLRGSDDARLDDIRTRGVGVCEIYRYVDAFCTEVYLPSADAKIRQSNPARRSHQSRVFVCCASGGSVLLFAAGVSCMLRLSAERRSGSYSRYIIKYIHDQDGYKSACSDL